MVRCKRREFHAFRAVGPVAQLGQFFGAFVGRIPRSLAVLTTASTKPQSFARLALQAFRRGAKNVGEIAADFALVDQSRQTARAGKHAQQRNLGQAHGRGAVVDQDTISSQASASS